MTIIPLLGDVFALSVTVQQGKGQWMGMWYTMSRRFEYITESLAFFSRLSVFVFQTVEVRDTIEVITMAVVEYRLTASEEEQTR
jgi:hypothetical protein